MKMLQMYLRMTRAVGFTPYPGPFCLLFSCCDHGCGWASSLRAVAYPSLIWSVFSPTLAPVWCHTSMFSVQSLPFSSFLVLAWNRFLV